MRHSNRHPINIRSRSVSTLAFSYDLGWTRQVFQWIPAVKTSPGSKLGASFALQVPMAITPSPLFPQQLKSQRMLSFSCCFCGGAVQRTRVRCGWRLGKGVALSPWPLYSNCFALLPQKRKGERQRERRKEKTTTKHLQKNTKNTPKQNKNPTKTKTKPNHQLKFTKYTFTKGGECGFPVYFLGDLAKQANMAKCPQNPKEQHTGEPKVTKGATTFWVETQWQFGAMLPDTVGFKSTFSLPSRTQTLSSCYTPACSMLKETSGCL